MNDVINYYYWHELELVEEVTYLGVIILSDKKFTAYIQRKLMTSNHQCQTVCVQDSLTPSS